MVIRITVAGVAGVGKTSVAKELARMLGLPYREVDTSQCWTMDVPAERQMCFLCTMWRQLNHGTGVYDNSMLTVRGYSVALFRDYDDRVMAVAAAALAWGCQENAVVLAASRETLEKRIRERLKYEPKRYANPIEEKIEVHWRAQEEILSKARVCGHPVYWVDGKLPSRIAREIFNDFERRGMLDVLLERRAR